MRQGWKPLLQAFISCLSLHSAAFAAEASVPGSQPKPKEESGTDADIDESDNELEDSSENSSDNDRSATERITNAGSVQIGTGYRKGLGLDLRVGIHQDENKLLEARFARFSAKNLANFDEMEIDTLLIQGKFFMGNSLFMAIATGWSQLRVKDKEMVNMGGPEDELFSYKGSTDQFLLSLSMGNQWQFGSWTTGLDWLNLYMPFSASKVDSKGEFSMAGGELRRLNNEQNLKAEAWEVDYGISLYVGYVW